MSEEMKQNLKNLPRMLSFYIVAIVSALAAYWLQLSPEDQVALQTQFPILIKLAPLAAAIAFVLARVKPQDLPQPPPEIEIKK